MWMNKKWHFFSLNYRPTDQNYHHSNLWKSQLFEEMHLSKAKCLLTSTAVQWRRTERRFFLLRAPMFGQKLLFHPPLKFPTFLSKQSLQSPPVKHVCRWETLLPSHPVGKHYFQLSKHAQTEQAIHDRRLQFLDSILVKHSSHTVLWSMLQPPALCYRSYTLQTNTGKILPNDSRHAKEKHLKEIRAMSYRSQYLFYRKK